MKKLFRAIGKAIAKAARAIGKAADAISKVIASVRKAVLSAVASVANRIFPGLGPIIAIALEIVIALVILWVFPEIIAIIATIILVYIAWKYVLEPIVTVYLAFLIDQQNFDTSIRDQCRKCQRDRAWYESLDEGQKALYSVWWSYRQAVCEFFECWTDERR